MRRAEGRSAGRQPELIALAGVVIGYLLAWTGHFVVERNRPAMESHPAWALLCDVRMFRLWITGRLGSEARVG